MHASSNDVYRSTEHRAVAPQEVERFSLPASTVPSSDDATEIRIRSGRHRKFSFREHRRQNIGLSRFLLWKMNSHVSMLDIESRIETFQVQESWRQDSTGGLLRLEREHVSVHPHVLVIIPAGGDIARGCSDCFCSCRVLFYIHTHTRVQYRSLLVLMKALNFYVIFQIISRRPCWQKLKWVIALIKSK